VTWKVRYTDGARDDLRRLFDFLLSKDPAAAKRVINQIDKGMLLLREFPFTCRKADPANPFLRELLISFGTAGYVALFEIEDSDAVTILAVRHQRESDYH
jgi:plasmid stabilization system protein ParE